MMEKLILDACCGGRSFWFDKHHPDALYIDIRQEKKKFVGDGSNYGIQPDIKMDFRALGFSDNAFKLIVWDPPSYHSFKPKLGPQAGVGDEKNE